MLFEEDPSPRVSLKKGLDILSRTRRQADSNISMTISVNDTEDDEAVDDAATTVKETPEEELLAAVDTAALLQKLKRSNSASRLLGLSVLMDAKADNYFVSPENYVGFKVSNEIF